MPPLLATIYSYTGEGTDQDVQATIVAEGINQGTVTVRELLRATHVDAARRAQHWEGRLSPRRWCVFDQTNYPSTRRRYNRSLGDTDARGPCRTLGSTCQPKTDSSALESHFWWWPRSMFAVVDAAAPMPPGGRTRLYGTAFAGDEERYDDDDPLKDAAAAAAASIDSDPVAPESHRLLPP